MFPNCPIAASASGGPASERASECWELSSDVSELPHSRLRKVGPSERASECLELHPHVSELPNSRLRKWRSSERASERMLGVEF